MRQLLNISPIISVTSKARTCTSYKGTNCLANSPLHQFEYSDIGWGSGRLPLIHGNGAYLMSPSLRQNY